MMNEYVLSLVAIVVGVAGLTAAASRQAKQETAQMI